MASKPTEGKTYCAPSIVLRRSIEDEMMKVGTPESKVTNTTFFQNPNPSGSPVLGPTFTEFPNDLSLYYPFLAGFDLTKEKPLNFPTFERRKFVSWPTVILKWKAWSGRMLVDPERTRQLQDNGLWGVIKLLGKEIPQNHSLIQAALAFWDPCFNCFRFNCGLMSPTILDVSQILGLPAYGVPFDITKPVELPFDYSFLSPTNGGYEKFLEIEQKKDGDIDQREYFSFILFTLCKYVLCHSGKRVMTEYIPLAFALSRGERFDFASYFLGHTYNYCYEAYRKESKQHNGGPAWFIQLWLLAYFPELQQEEATIPEIPLHGERLLGFKPMEFESYLRFFESLSIQRKDELFFPFTNMDYTIPWLREAVLKKGSIAYQFIWFNFLSSREIFIGAFYKTLRKGISEVYSPNQFARQFGLTQGIPIPYCSITNNKLGKRTTACKEHITDNIQRYVRTYRLFEPTDFDNYPDSTFEYINWWNCSINDYLRRPTVLAFNTNIGIEQRETSHGSIDNDTGSKGTTQPVVSKGLPAASHVQVSDPDGTDTDDNAPLRKWALKRKSMLELTELSAQGRETRSKTRRQVIFETPVNSTTFPKKILKKSGKAVFPAEETTSAPPSPVSREAQKKKAKAKPSTVEIEQTGTQSDDDQLPISSGIHIKGLNAQTTSKDPNITLAVYPDVLENVQEFKTEVETFCTRILTPAHPQQSSSAVDNLKFMATPIVLSHSDKDTLAAILYKFLRIGVRGIVGEKLVPQLKQCTNILSLVQIPKTEVRDQLMTHLVAFESNVDGFKRIVHEGSSRVFLENTTLPILENRAQELAMAHHQKTSNLLELKAHEERLKAELASVSQAIEKVTTEIADLESQASKDYQEIKNLKAIVGNQEKTKFLCTWADETFELLCNIFSSL